MRDTILGVHKQKAAKVLTDGTYFFSLHINKDTHKKAVRLKEKTQQNSFSSIQQVNMTKMSKLSF